MGKRRLEKIRLLVQVHTGRKGESELEIVVQKPIGSASAQFLVKTSVSQLLNEDPGARQIPAF